MEIEQTERPAANLSQTWPGWLKCGRMMVLHAFLVSARRLEEEIVVLSSMSHGQVNGTKFLSDAGSFPGNLATF